MGSPAAVLTLGLGPWGSAGGLLTLGFGAAGLVVLDPIPRAYVAGTDRSRAAVAGTDRTRVTTAATVTA